MKPNQSMNRCLKILLAVLAVLGVVQLVKAVVLQAVCLIVIIGGVIYLASDCHKHNAPPAGPPATNAPAPPHGPTNTAGPALFTLASSAVPGFQILISDDDTNAVWENISGGFTNRDGFGQEYHTLGTFPVALVVEDLNGPWAPYIVRLWFSGSDAKGTVIGALYSNSVPIQVGQVVRSEAVSTLKLEEFARTRPQRFFRPIESAGITNSPPPTY